jgi:cleavage and polyadenylation specificity factor subunit 1
LGEEHAILTDNQEKLSSELVASTGAGHTGSLTFFSPSLPVRTKRVLHAIGGNKGIWEIPLRQAPKHPHAHPGVGSVVISTDGIPAPGLSRVAAKSPKGEVSFLNRSAVLTIGAGGFFGGTAIIQVTGNSVRLLETGKFPLPHIKNLLFIWNRWR